MNIKNKTLFRISQPQAFLNATTCASHTLDPQLLPTRGGQTQSFTRGQQVLPPTHMHSHILYFHIWTVSRG